MPARDDVPEDYRTLPLISHWSALFDPGNELFGNLSPTRNAQLLVDRPSDFLPSNFRKYACVASISLPLVVLQIEFRCGRPSSEELFKFPPNLGHIQLSLLGSLGPYSISSRGPGRRQKMVGNLGARREENGEGGGSC